MSPRRTRPLFLQLLAVLFAFAMIAAACGDDDTASDTTGSDATTGTDATTGSDATTGTDTTDDTGSADTGTDTGGMPDDMDPEGTLLLATDLTASTNTAILDMPQMTTPAVNQHLLLTGVLMKEEFDGTYTPDLAVRADVTSPTSIEVELRPGVVFTDGSPLDAETAAWNILRNRDEGQGGAMADELRQVSTVDVVDDVTFVINFADPVVGTFYPMLSRGETMMWSKVAVEGDVDMQATPIGAGPYTLESLEFENRLILVKNPGYWDAENVHIPRIEFVHVNGAVDPNASVNAISSGDIDIAPLGLVPTQVEALSGSGMEFDTAVTPSVLFWGQMCKGGPKLQVPALADIKVRQALNYAIDRDLLNQTIFNGDSEGQYGFWPEGHPFHDPALDDYYAQDLDKAKELLAETEWADGFAFETVVAPAGSAGEQFSLLVQQDWAKIGVDVTFTPSTDLINDFFISNSKPLYFFPLTRSGLDKVTRNLTGESIGNICQYENERLNEQIAIIKSVGSNSDEAKEAWWALDRIALEDAVNIFGIFGTDTVGYFPDRVGNVEWIPQFQGVRSPDITDMYVKKS